MHKLHTIIDNKLTKSTAWTEHVIQFSAELNNYIIQTVRKNHNYTVNMQIML